MSSAPFFRPVAAAMLSLACACAEPHGGSVASQQAAGTAASSTPASSAATKGRAPEFPHVAKPSPMRGLYINRWAALGRKLPQLIGVAEKTEINALVIDVKDDRGFVLYQSDIALAHAIGADTVRPMSRGRIRAYLDTMYAHRIYPIARIVVAKDPLLAQAKLEWAIKRKSDLQPWLDKKGKPWLDPHHREIWQYAADLAREAYSLGFSEVQFDYVRFPDEKHLISEAVYPLANGRLRAQMIREQLGFLRSTLKPLGIPVTADVFGLTATDTTDMGIGQRWEMFVDQVDVVLPMVYPSHFTPGMYGLSSPNAHPYTTVDRVLKDVIRRSAKVPGAAAIIPWYQDFTLGPPHYNTEQVRSQIKAGYDNGFQSWILWNPRSVYTLGALQPRKN